MPAKNRKNALYRSLFTYELTEPYLRQFQSNYLQNENMRGNEGRMYMRKTGRQMKDAMIKYQPTARGRVDRGLLGQVSDFLGGYQNLRDHTEGGRGCLDGSAGDGSAGERSRSVDLGRGPLRLNSPSHPAGSADGRTGWASRSVIPILGL